MVDAEARSPERTARCTFQSTGTDTACDEDQFSYPEVASDGTVYVQFLNGQNDGEWEVDFDFDSQLMVVKSDGRRRDLRSDPVAAVQLEDGLPTCRGR